MQSMTESMRGLKDAASSGGFKVSREGTQAYIAAIQRASDDVSAMEQDLMEVRRETKLGTSPDGRTLSRYNQEGAMGGVGTTGIVPAIEQLRAALDDALAAMKTILQTYENVDSGNANSIRNVH
ncbi:hypothetical protein GCM10011609_69750 [Lentzea pudingi]|uniref:Uncharacterized protein n=2 Tax=Lentzea pudingi TaxID=1789439 RepID=A0ABQ2ILU3_9PSEU|nr:hypothetical protein GCM10011609_69750 [Lentzea pudingi]